MYNYAATALTTALQPPGEPDEHQRPAVRPRVRPASLPPVRQVRNTDGLSALQLFSRYFQGDIKAASYENYGTDIYIYLRALAAESVEQLPIWSDTASSKISATSSELSDWVSQPQYSVKSTPQ